MSFGRTTRKTKKRSKKSKSHGKRTKKMLRKHARRNRKPYAKKKVGLRRRAPGQTKFAPGQAHKITDIPVYVQRNRNAGKAKNALEVCIAIPGRKDAGGEQYACASGKNPRSAMAKALRQGASVIGKRTGAFAGL